MTSIILLCVVAYGSIKLGKFIKNHPERSAEAIRWIKEMFGR